MNLSGIQTLETSLQALPVALIFSRQLMLPQASLVSAPAGPMEEPGSLRENGTHYISASLKNIEGYSHDGLNE